MKTTLAALLALVMLALGGTLGFYFGTVRAKRFLPTTSGTSTTLAVAPFVGKFQIVSGEYIFHSGQSETKENGVFRINTETGEASAYVQLVDANGKLQTYWNPIEQH